jgi:DNA replication factor GINS
MDLDELRSVRRTERQKDSLQHLRDSFYEDVAAYIAERKAERRRTAEAADDPYGNPEVRRLTDEIETAEDVVEAIYERRVGKVVKLASFAAADMSADTSGLTAEERDLFDDLVERIKRNRRTVLDTLAGEDGDATDAPAPGRADPDPAGEPQPPEADPGDTPAADAADRAAPADDPPAPDDVLAAAMGGDDAASDATPETATEPGSPTPPPPDSGPDPDPERDPAASAANGAETDGGDPAGAAGSVADSPAPSGTPPRGDGVGTDAAPDPAGSDRVTLRITADVGRIYGVDEREYDLESEDVVRLPATNAGPLVDRGAAERLE